MTRVPFPPPTWRERRADRHSCPLTSMRVWPTHRSGQGRHSWNLWQDVWGLGGETPNRLVLRKVISECTQVSSQWPMPKKKERAGQVLPVRDGDFLKWEKKCSLNSVFVLISTQGFFSHKILLLKDLDFSFKIIKVSLPVVWWLSFLFFLDILPTSLWLPRRH